MGRGRMLIKSDFNVSSQKQPAAKFQKTMLIYFPVGCVTVNYCRTFVDLNPKLTGS